MLGLLLAPAARAQLQARFEPPTYTGTAAGQPLAGQDGWFAPGPPVPWNVHTYSGNPYLLPPAPGGGAQFAAAHPVGGNAARAVHLVNFGGGDIWTATWDVTATLNGAPPTTPQLGTFSLEDSATQRYWQSQYLWTNPGVGTIWTAQYIVFAPSGVPLPPQTPGAAWQNLQRSRWYRQSTTWQFSTNQILEVTITDLASGATAVVNPAAWYLHGGTNPPRPMPTGVSLSATGSDLNVLAADNVMVSPQVVVAGFAPPAAGFGDTVQIFGSGFGTNPDDLSVAMIDGARAHPLTVISATPNAILARVEALPANAQPGPIRVFRGVGARGGETPNLLDIIPEDPQGVWVWQRLADPRTGVSPDNMTPIIRPPPPGTTWAFGQVVSGRLETTVSGNRLPNTLVGLQVRTLNGTARMGSSMGAGGVRLRRPGDAQNTAGRLCEALRSGFAREGIVVDCQATNTGPNQWKITLEQRNAQNQMVPIETGALDVTLVDPILINPFPVGSLTAFFHAGLTNLGTSARVGVDLSGNDGATITPGAALSGGIHARTQPIDLGPAGSSFTIRGWGVVNATPEQLIGQAGLRRAGSGLDVLGDFTAVGAANVTVSVFYNTVNAGTATLPAGQIGQLVAAGGTPQVVECGHLAGPTPGMWITLDRLCTFVPSAGPNISGNQLRMLASGGTATVQGIQSFDIAAGLNGPRAGSFVIDSEVQGGVCYANCDGSTTVPILNVADFTCFLQTFAAGSDLANCDGSTTPPTLNVADFTCFLQQFAAGCP